MGHWKQSLAAGIMGIGLLFGSTSMALGAKEAAPVTSNSNVSASQQHAFMDRTVRYFKDLKTLMANFIQINPNGSFTEGTFYLKTPGKLRFEYVKETPLLIISDGLWLVVQDTELESFDRVPLSATPLRLFDVDEFDLRSDAFVDQIHHDGQTLAITLRDKEDPEQGAFTLVFTTQPFELRQWIVRDAQDQVTTISLGPLSKNAYLKPDLFIFNEPNNEAPD